MGSGRKKGTGARPVDFHPDGLSLPGPAAGEAAQPDLAAKEIPAIIEYRIGPEPWRCGKFDRLAEEFPGVDSGEKMALFHTAMMAKPGKGWTIVKRLFGIMPRFPDPDTDERDLRVWSVTELRADMALEPEFLREEIQAMQAYWGRFFRAEGPAIKPSSNAPRVPAAGTVDAAPDPRPGDLNLQDESEVLKRLYIQVEFGTPVEREWFMGRVADYLKALEDSAARELARAVLMSELQLFRLDTELNDARKCPVGEGKWKSTLALKRDIEASYNTSFAKLQKMCPWIGGVEGRQSFLAVMSEITKAIQEYQAMGTTSLVDGFMTAVNLQVECRMSLQSPNPRYRAGLTLAVNEARAGLWDPKWKSRLPAKFLAALDAGWSAAYRRAAEEQGLPAPDLMKDGKEGEYEDLAKTPEENGAGA